MKFYKIILAFLVFGFLLSSFSIKKEDSKVNDLEQYSMLRTLHQSKPDYETEKWL